MATTTVEARTPAPEEISARLDRLPFLGFHLRIAATLGLGTMFDAFDSLSIAAALTMIVATFHFDLRTAGALGGAAFAGQFFGAIAFGYVSEHIGRKWAFVLALTIFAACSGAAAAATSLNGIFIARVVQGIGLGAEVPIAVALFNEFVRGSARGRFVMLYESLFVWGLVLAPIAGLILLQALGPAHAWRALFALGGLPIIVAIIAALTLPESPRWLAAKGRTAEASAIVDAMEAEAKRGGKALLPAIPVARIVREQTSFLELFQGIYAKRTFVAWTQWFCAYFCANGFQIWTPTLFVKFGGLPTRDALALTIGMTATQLVWAYLTSGVIDRVGRVPWFAGGFALAALASIGGALAIGVFGVHGWQPLLIFGIFVVGGTSVNALGVYVYTPEQYPTRMRAWGTATGSSLNRVASFFAPLAIGWLLGANLGMASVFAMVAVVAAFGAIVIWTMGEETKLKTLEELSP
jgi:MFS transporter, putative metabolite:H+ symporter